MTDIIIFAGGLGSGKSETALNYALELSRAREHVVLVDLDLVNPYFCSRELEQVLKEKGVKLIAPIEQLRFGDVPQVPADVVGYLGVENQMVIDVGGDEVGAWVLGYLRGYMRSRHYEMLLVINPFRPFSSDIKKIMKLREALERASKLHFTGVVSNPNLAASTSIETIMSGHKQVQEFTRALNLPIKFLVVQERFSSEVNEESVGVEVKPIRLYLRPEWL